MQINSQIKACNLNIFDSSVIRPLKQVFGVLKNIFMFAICPLFTYCTHPDFIVAAIYILNKCTFNVLIACLNCKGKQELGHSKGFQLDCIIQYVNVDQDCHLMVAKTHYSCYCDRQMRALGTLIVLIRHQLVSHCVGSRNQCLQTGGKVVKETEVSMEMQVQLDLNTTFN